MAFHRYHRSLSMDMLAAMLLLCISLGDADAGHPELARFTKRQKAVFDNLKAVENEVRTWTYCGKEFRGMLKGDSGFRVVIQGEGDGYGRQDSYFRSLFSRDDLRFLDKTYPGFKNPPVLSLRTWTIPEKAFEAGIVSPLSGGHHGQPEYVELVLKSGAVLTVDKHLLSNDDRAFCESRDGRRQTYQPRKWHMPPQRISAALNGRDDHTLLATRSDGTALALDIRLMSAADQRLVMAPPRDVAPTEIIAILDTPGCPSYYTRNAYHFLGKTVKIDAREVTPVSPSSPRTVADDGYSHGAGRQATGGWVQAILDENPGCSMFTVRTMTVVKTPNWLIHPEDRYPINGQLPVVVPKVKLRSFERSFAVSRPPKVGQRFPKTKPIRVQLCVWSSDQKQDYFPRKNLWYYGRLR